MSDPALTVADLENSGKRVKPILKQAHFKEIPEESGLSVASKLDGEGLISTCKPADSNDFRWKVNSITSRHHPSRQFDASPCQIFRQRLNHYYERDMRRCTTWTPLEPQSQVMRYSHR